MAVSSLIGALGIPAAQPGLLQLGGPSLPKPNYARNLPTAAGPFIAHVYQNDGVTPILTSQIQDRPTLVFQAANGGYEQITINLGKRAQSSVYGQVVYGPPVVYGGQMNQGNVVRLSEQNGDGSFRFSGIVEDLPVAIKGTSADYTAVLSPLGFELDDTFVQLLYTQPVDISQIVRDAVSQTQHLTCDQVSVPAATGILTATAGQLDFRNQSAKQVIETCRSIAGATWYWHCDELGRIWFQPMGATAIYTIPRAQAEEVNLTASIQSLKNDVLAIGGVPANSAQNAVASYTGLSQQAYGKRSLNPPLSLPNINDQPTLAAIATSIGQTLDRVWQRIQLRVPVGGFNQRIHASQPGGAMFRYWSPAKSPLPESIADVGAYAGPYITQRIESDGTRQSVTAGNMPVTSQTDVDNMVKALVQRVSANSAQVTAAALNLPNQVITGTFQSGPGVPPPGGGSPGTLWRLNQQEFAAIDPGGIPRAEFGNLAANGASPAQWGFRASDANGVALFDSLGVLGNPKLLGSNSTTTAQTIIGPATNVAVTNSSVTFSLTRQQKVLTIFQLTAQPGNGTPAGFAYANLRMDGAAAGIYALAFIYGPSPAAYQNCNMVRQDTLAAGSHTADMIISSVDTGTTLTTWQCQTFVYGVGS